jgi:hypothetical protein
MNEKMTLIPENNEKSHISKQCTIRIDDSCGMLLLLLSAASRNGVGT